jgi:D-3-phosphoglycerate dehydrogenase
MAPRVLVSDKPVGNRRADLPRSRRRRDFIPKLGKDKEKLLEIIGEYDGLAIRSATKVTEKLIAAATNLKVIGRAGIGVDNVDIPGRLAPRHHRDEHALRQLDHHRRTRHRDDVRRRPPAA